jgi:hypothetical protein
VAGDEPGDPVRYAVAVHLLMSQDEIELWQGLVDRCRLAVDDVMHAAALWGLEHRIDLRMASRAAAGVDTGHAGRSGRDATTP